MTQLQLATKVGASQAIIANWESGRFTPYARDLPALAKALHYPHIDDLYPEELRP